MCLRFSSSAADFKTNRNVSVLITSFIITLLLNIKCNKVIECEERRKRKALIYFEVHDEICASLRLCELCYLLNVSISRKRLLGCVC